MGEKRHTARRAARTAVASRFVVLTGLAGSGKSQAIKALEDLGYFCVDNLPVELLPMLADLTLQAGNEIARAAVVVDIREGRMLDEFPRVQEAPAETRAESRSHFSGGGRSVARASVQRDTTPASARARPIGPRGHPRGARHAGADPCHGRPRGRHVGDDRPRTAPCVHGRGFWPRARQSTHGHDPQLRIQARDPGRFGSPVRRQVPAEPHFVPTLRPQTGRDPDVVKYLDKSKSTHEFLSHTLNLLTFLVPQYVIEGKSYLTIGIGCTGGRHRSVAIAEALKKGLSGIKGVRIRVKHRDIANE